MFGCRNFGDKFFGHICIYLDELLNFLPFTQPQSAPRSLSKASTLVFEVLSKFENNLIFSSWDTPVEGLRPPTPPAFQGFALPNPRP